MPVTKGLLRTMPRLKSVVGGSNNVVNHPSIAASNRVALISQHLHHGPHQQSLAFSTRTASSLSQQATNNRKLSTGSNTPPSTMSSTQAPHATLLIPGPIEFDDAVLQSMSHFR